MDRAGITFTMDEVRYLVGEIEKLKAFPEVPEALARLRTKYKLVVLSNGDPDMLSAAYTSTPGNGASAARASAMRLTLNVIPARQKPSAP